MAVKTFDKWNRAETKALTEGEDRDIALNVRKARSGALARFMLWDDYLHAAESQGFEPEPLR